MDKKFIDADTLAKGIMQRVNNSAIRNWLFAIINETSAADVQEVRHGLWLIGDWKCKKGKARYMCSECKSIEKRRKFCPNCGAKMNG